MLRPVPYESLLSAIVTRTPTIAPSLTRAVSAATVVAFFRLKSREGKISFFFLFFFPPFFFLFPRLPIVLCPTRPCIAWDSFSSGTQEAIVLTAGDPVTPSETDVYQIDLLEDPLVLVPVEVSDAGAFALLLEHGMDEIQVVVTSPSGAVLAAAVEEGGEEAEEDHDEDEDEEEDTSPATGTQWANALIAALLVSSCR